MGKSLYDKVFEQHAVRKLDSGQYQLLMGLHLIHEVTSPQAFAMLRARLYELELQKREAQTDAMNAAKTDIGWGHQIRSYVLQPYQMVKDLRTGVETGNPAAVLDGDIDRFLAAALAQRIEGADVHAGGG